MKAGSSQRSDSTLVRYVLNYLELLYYPHKIWQTTKSILSRSDLEHVLKVSEENEVLCLKPRCLTLLIGSRQKVNGRWSHKPTASMDTATTGHRKAALAKDLSFVGHISIAKNQILLLILVPGKIQMNVILTAGLE